MLKEWMCKLAHVLFGTITILSAKVGVVLPIVFLVTFVLYEFDEEWNIKDTAYEELREYGIGLVIGVMLVLAL